MKRTHHDVSRRPPLGALEFAAALNGDDAKAVLNALKRFTKTVRRERRQALAVEESGGDEEESDSFCEDSEREESPVKRQKVETWMQDTKSYNVPFVGTSVVRGDTGTVQKGTWPTGLLEAYLKSSPLAMELTGTSLIPPQGVVHRSLLKTKFGHKLSHKIHVAHLEALEQLLSAAISIQGLKRDMGIISLNDNDDDSTTVVDASFHYKFVTTLLKERLPSWLKLINDEVHKKRDLVAVVVRVVTSLAATSAGAARQQCRELDATLKPGTLRAALKTKKKKKPNSSSKSDNADKDEKDVEETQKPKNAVYDAQTACVRLAATLLESGDAHVVSYISTGGSKERKINPGILYLAVRNGLMRGVFDKSSTVHDDGESLYFQAVSRLLNAIRRILLPSPDKRKRIMSSRTLADLLSGDALERLCHVATCCSSMSNPEQDQEFPYNTLEGVCMEGRRLLFPLLSDKVQSLFLRRISESNDKVATMYTQQVVRAMNFLSNANCTLAIQKFVLDCVSTTPLLLPALFRSLTFPDARQGPFAFVTRLSFLSRLIRQAPLETVNIRTVDQVLLSVIPFHIKKGVLTKSMHSTNSLVVAETLKLMIALLTRFRVLLESDLANDKETLTGAFVKRLPEVQAIVAAVRSRFDPFTNAQASSAIVSGYMCDLLIPYATILPSVINAVKFDWIKLLPDNTDEFISSSPVLQLKLLRALEAIHDAQKKCPQRQSVSSGSCRIFLEIAITSHQPQVYEFARKQALNAILDHVQKGTDSETNECLQYEASLWVDGMTQECITEFCALLDKFGQVSFQHAITVAEAWKTFFASEPMPSVCFSPILTAALCSQKASREFAQFTNQVALKCLLYHQCPLSLAALISHVGSKSFRAKTESGSVSASFRLVCGYAQSLCDFGALDTRERPQLLKSATEALFSPDSCQSILASSGNLDSSESFRKDLFDLYQSNPQSFGKDGVAHLRQCLHMIIAEQQKTNDESTRGANSFSQLESILTLVLQDSDKAVRVRGVESVFGHPFLQQQETSSVQSFDMELLALTCASKGKDLLDESDSLSKMLRNLTMGIADDLAKTTSEEDLFSTKKWRSKILSLSMMVPFIEPTNAKAITEGLLRLCSQSVAGNESEKRLPLSVGLSLHWLEAVSSEQQGENAESMVSARLVFETWRKLRHAGFQYRDIQSICQLLEAIMVKALNQEDDGITSALMYSMLLQMDPDKLIELCLFSKDAVSKTPVSGDSRLPSSHNPFLLSSIINADCMRFAPSLINQVMSENDGKCCIRGKFQSCSIGRALSVVLRSNAFRETPLYIDVANAVASHAASLLRGVSDLCDLQEYRVIFETLPEVVRQSRLSSENVDGLIEVATAILIAIKNESIEKGDALVEKNLCQLAISLCCPADNDDELELGESSTRVRLSSALFVRLCEDLQISLRRFFRRRHSSNSIVDGQHPEEIVDSIYLVVKHAKAFNKQICKNDGSPFVGVVRSCLKHGIATADHGDSSVSAACLSLIRALITEVSGISSKLRHLSEIFEPSRIFAMVTTHSKFSLALALTAGQVDTPSKRVKLELLRLLLCCVSLSEDRISFDDEMWNTLLAGYNASVGIVDCTLRRLFQVYSDRTIEQGKECELPFMDKFRWADAAQQDFVSDKRTQKESQNGISAEASAKHWEWFINSLDVSRVRATLSQFPVWDHLNSPPLSDVESWITVDDAEGKPDGNENDFFEDESESSVSSSNSHDNLPTSPRDANHGRLSHEANRSVWQDDWSGNGPDNRYSPAFIIPILFGVMECFSAMTEEASFSRNVDGDEEMEAMETVESSTEEKEANRAAFATVTQRLCEKGGLCLVLAALSSKCPTLRQVAVATLGLFLKALKLEEAHKIAAWRDRPQLAMILNSVQRGLAVRRALQLSNRENVSQQAGLLVPLLPAVSAVFLARVSLIVVKPGDAIFAPMNRYFLKIEDDFGAYRDVSRLPAFISLFCSSSDESGQARRERLWALQQLKDGFVDEYCYRAVASCHAPELLMTSFDSYASRQVEGDGDLESILLLETLTTIIARGGSGAARHLFGRIGLLSWFRAILVGRPTSELLSSTPCQKAFLRLISVAFENINLTGGTVGLDYKSTLEEISGLAHPVLQLYVNSLSSCKFAGRRDKVCDIEGFVVSVCDALYSLKRATVQISGGDSSVKAGCLLGVRPLGMLVSSVVTLLNSAPTHLRGTVVRSVCSLPFRFDPEKVNDASCYCESMLKFVVQESGKNHNLTIEVFRRVSIFSTLFGPALDKEGTVLSLVLACRRTVLDYPEGLREWVKSLSILLRQSSANDAAAIAKNVLQGQQEKKQLPPPNAQHCLL